MLSVPGLIIPVIALPSQSRINRMLSPSAAFDSHVPSQDPLSGWPSCASAPVDAAPATVATSATARTRDALATSRPKTELASICIVPLRIDSPRGSPPDPLRIIATGCIPGGGIEELFGHPAAHVRGTGSVSTTRPVPPDPPQSEQPRRKSFASRPAAIATSKLAAHADANDVFCNWYFGPSTRRDAIASPELYAMRANIGPRIRGCQERSATTNIGHAAAARAG